MIIEPRPLTAEEREALDSLCSQLHPSFGIATVYAALLHTEAERDEARQRAAYLYDLSETIEHSLNRAVERAEALHARVTALEEPQ